MAEEVQTSEQTTVLEPEAAATTQTPPAETTASPAFDPSTLAPEAKAYFETQQQKVVEELEAKYKPLEEKARGFESLTSDPRFQAWQKSGFKGTEEAPKNPFEEMSPEDYAALLNDPKKFGTFLQTFAREMGRKEFEPQVKQVAEEHEKMKIALELKEFALKHTDFWDEKVNKAFNEVATRYGGNISIEDAYYLAKRPFAQQEAIQKAHEVADGKRQASLPKPGVSSARSTGTPIKAGSFEEAAKLALAEAAAGRSIEDITY